MRNMSRPHVVIIGSGSNSPIRYRPLPPAPIGVEFPPMREDRDMSEVIPEDDDRGGDGAIGEEEGTDENEEESEEEIA